MGFKEKVVREYFENGAIRTSSFKDGSEGWYCRSSYGGDITDDMIPVKVETLQDEQLWKKNWCDEWKRLEEKDQHLVWAVYGKDVLREEFKNNIESLKSPSKLVQGASSFLYKRGWNKPCTRCGGSGTYSYCQVYGRTCFKCSGQKNQMVNPTKAEINKWLKKHPEGLVVIKDEIRREKGEYLVKEGK